MLCLKKMYNDELLQLTLILSLLRVYPNTYFETDPEIRTESYDFGNGTSWGLYTPSVTRLNNVNPKSLDRILLNYEREVFADLNSLGRYNRINTIRNLNVTAYLLNIDCGDNCNINSTENNVLEERIINENIIENEASEAILPDPDLPSAAAIDLTQEDMDLIEILWKQDVDLGFSLDVATDKLPKPDDELDTKKLLEPAPNIPKDDIEKIKALEAVNNNTPLKTEDTDDPNVLGDIWSGLSYTIDTETGEYVLKGGLDDDCLGECDSPLPIEDLPLPECFLEEALHLVGLDEEPQQDIGGSSKDSCGRGSSSSSSSSSSSGRSVSERSGTSGLEPEPDLSSVDLDLDSDIDSQFSLLTDMIQTQFHPPSRPFQGRMPFMRTMSIEQRWQDLANLLSIPAPGEGGGGAAGAGGAVMSPHHHHPFSHHPAHHPALHSYNHTHSLGYAHDTARSVLLHNATLNPPVGDINSTGPYSSIGSSSNLGSAVATSMNLTNSTEPMVDPSCVHYKIDTPHDMLYYPQNQTNEINQTTEGFLSSILNDEDLQLMDLAMTDGIDPMRVLYNSNNASSMSSAVNTTSAAIGRLDTEKIDTSSDSALSSMGSERVPSLSDGEWCDAGSDSGHTPADYIVDYNSKYRPYDYSYNNRPQPLSSVDNADRSRIAPVAQKKHQMFGKRYFQEQGTSAVNQPPPASIKYEFGNPTISSFSNQAQQAEGVTNNKTTEIKYSCTVEFTRQLHASRNSLDHVQHNHTYHLPAECTGAMQRPVSRDKGKSRKSEEEHLTRDEKRARALNVPLSVHDIINLPMDEFNERLSKYDLNEAQLTLIRDIRRRGKNKVAAQNCRKRKLDQILSLADEVRDMRDRKHRLLAERDFMVSERQRMKDKFALLYRHIFENLRDPDGNHYSQYQYSLQQSPDGSVLVVPRANTTEQENKEPHQNCKK